MMIKWFKLAMLFCISLLCSSAVLANCDTEHGHLGHLMPESAASIDSSTVRGHGNHSIRSNQPVHSNSITHGVQPDHNDHSDVCDHVQCDCTDGHCASTVLGLSTDLLLTFGQQPASHLPTYHTSIRPSNERRYYRPPISIV